VIFGIRSTARSNHDVVIGVASSISAFVLASVLFLSIGVACGCHWGQKWRKKSDSEDRSTENRQTSEPAPPNPLYEDVFTQEQEPLELKENAAYSSVTVSGL
jgi:hypothetical protein